ncbi:unnamed protein product [Sphagnum balticum]
MSHSDDEETMLKRLKGRFARPLDENDEIGLLSFVFLQQLKRVQIIARFGEALLDVAQVEFVDICEIAPPAAPSVKTVQQPTRQLVVREVEPVSFITDADEILRSTVQRMAVVHMNMTPPARASSVEGGVQTPSSQQNGGGGTIVASRRLIALPSPAMAHRSDAVNGGNLSAHLSGTDDTGGASANTTITTDSSSADDERRAQHMRRLGENFERVRMGNQPASECIFLQSERRVNRERNMWPTYLVPDSDCLMFANISPKARSATEWLLKRTSKKSSVRMQKKHETVVDIVFPRDTSV